MMKGIVSGLMAASILTVFSFAPIAVAQEATTDQPAWAQATVSVTGSAVTSEDPATDLGDRRQAALREAKLDALRLLTERVYATVTDSGATVGDIILADEVLRGPVEAFVQGAKLTGTRFLPEGRVEADMEIGLQALPVILGK